MAVVDELSSSSWFATSHWNDSTAVISGYTLSGETNTSTAFPGTPKQVPLSGFIDTATKEAAIEVVNCYLLPVVVVMGVCGNVMSLVVLLVHGMNSSTNVLLLGLTASDLGFLITMYARKVSCIVSHFDPATSKFIETGLIPNVFMINRIFNCSTPFLTMLITLERCLAVTFPLKVQTIVTSFRMKVMVCGIYLVSASLQFPFFFIYKIQWTTNKVTGEQVPRLAGTPFFYDNFQAISAFNNIVLSAVFNYLPLGVVIVCSLIVVATVRRSSRWRKAASQISRGGGAGDGTSSSDGDERRMTRMLMTVVAVYVGCYIPRCVFVIANSLAPHSFNSLGGRYTNLFYVISAVLLLLFAINSSSNFVIYLLMSRKFFHTYKRIFLCEGLRNRREANQAKLLRGGNKPVTSISSATGDSSIQYRDA